MTTDWSGWRAERRQQVESWLKGWHEGLEGPDTLVEAMGYSLFAGGKRLRPVLVLAAGEAVAPGAEPTAEARDLARALEMVHTYSLIHDDLPILDDDDLRRGRPTNHKVHGEAMALLAGDALLTEAFAVLAGGDAPAEGEAGARRARLVARLARAAGAGGMVGGQVLDVARTAVGQGLEAVQTVHRMKTAALIACACAGGADAAGGSPEQVAALEAYGQAVGLAFQVVDDLLDATGDAEVLGKAVGKDEDRDTATVPRAIGLEAARALAERLTEEAVAALAPLGEAAEPLRRLAREALERRS